MVDEIDTTEEVIVPAEEEVEIVEEGSEVEEAPLAGDETVDEIAGETPEVV